MRTVIITIALALCISHVSYSNTINIPIDYPTIQEGIDAAATGDVVLVAPGSYMENIVFYGKAVEVRSAMGANRTIIDGKGCQDPARYGSVVTFVHEEQNDSILDGFTLRNGRGAFLHNIKKFCGAGILCINSSPTIQNCIIKNNHAEHSGGGMCTKGGHPKVKNCVFMRNTALWHGGGIYCREGNPWINDCVFIDNSADWFGGAIHTTFDGNARVTHSDFIQNYAYKKGGAIYNSLSKSSFSYCLIEGNTTHLDGGGAANWTNADTEWKNCIFRNNSAYDGGAIINHHCSPKLSQCVFCDNTARNGGAWYSIHGEAKLVNCSLVNNTAPEGRGGCFFLSSSADPKLFNCILWGNTALIDNQIYIAGSSNARINYSCVQGGYPGLANIAKDPQFVDLESSDIHLTFNSPCKDAGANSASNKEHDFEGDARIAFGTVDMGADEFHTHLYCTGDFCPNGCIEANFVGTPNTAPVGLIIGSGVIDPPIHHKWGDFCLKGPWFVVPLPAIPADGILTVSDHLPRTPEAPYDIPMQALIGMRFSNLFKIEVR